MKTQFYKHLLAGIVAMLCYVSFPPGLLAQENTTGTVSLSDTGAASSSGTAATPSKVSSPESASSIPAIFDAVVTIVFALAFAGMVYQFWQSIKADDPIEFESHWGGLGGGLGGCKLSKSLCYLVAWIALGSLLIAFELAVYHPDLLRSSQEGGRKQGGDSEGQNKKAEPVPPATPTPSPAKTPH